MRWRGGEKVEGSQRMKSREGKEKKENHVLKICGIIKWEAKKKNSKSKGCCWPLVTKSTTPVVESGGCEEWDVCSRIFSLNATSHRCSLHVCTAMCLHECKLPGANPLLAKTGKNREEREKPSLSKSNCSWKERAVRGRQRRRKEEGKTL